MRTTIKVGACYGKLTIIKRDDSIANKIWMCKCECGRTIYKAISWIRRWRGCEYCRHPSDFSIEDKPGEIWRDIEGFEGLYQVSNKGRVKSLPRLRNCIHPHITNVHILRPRFVGKGKYAAVALHDKSRGIKRQVKVHQLVAKAFISNPCGYVEINHKDEDKWNNCVDNLEWCSRSYNVNYDTANNKRASHLQQPIAMVGSDGVTLKVFESFRKAAKHIGVTSGSISHAVKGGYRLYGYYWKRITPSKE